MFTAGFNPIMLNVFVASSTRSKVWTDGFISDVDARGGCVWDARSTPSPIGSAIDNSRPDFLVCNLLSAADAFAPAPWMVIIDEPNDGIDFFQETGLSLREAAQRTASEHAACSLLMSLGAPVFRVGIDEIHVDGLGHVHAEPRGNDVDEGPRLLSIYGSGPDRAQSSWPVQLFEADSSGSRSDGQIEFDLTGRSRCLVHGPHIDLPPGIWEVYTRVYVDPLESQVHLTFDWGIGGVDIVAWDGTIRRRGWYEVKLRKEWSSIGAAQFRVSSRPSFEGRLVFTGCAVTGSPRSSGV